MPGSGHLCSGQTLYIKLRGGDTLADLLLHREDGEIAGGLKMANGTNSRRDPPFPGTRGKSAALVREAFLEAQEYAAALKAHDPDHRNKRTRNDWGNGPDWTLGKRSFWDWPDRQRP